MHHQAVETINQKDLVTVFSGEHSSKSEWPALSQGQKRVVTSIFMCESCLQKKGVV